jgi:hypothetical protein
MVKDVTDYEAGSGKSFPRFLIAPSSFARAVQNDWMRGLAGEDHSLCSRCIASMAFEARIGSAASCESR